MPTMYKGQVAYTLEEASALSKEHIRTLAATIPARLREMKTKRNI